MGAREDEEESGEGKRSGGRLRGRREP